MADAIILQVTHPTAPPGPIDGFRFLWAMYVNGYDPARHCQPGLRGRRVAEFCTPTARSGAQVMCDRMDRYPYLYVCGVAAGPLAGRAARNLHFPLRHVPGAVATITSHLGHVFTAQHAEVVTVPELPASFAGLSRAHWRCRTFQFAVAMFGHPLRVQ
ncbi:MAG: hypothetical protein V4813_16210 [Gemmatimonadota bacterium]